MRKLKAHRHLAALGLACVVLAGCDLASAGTQPRPAGPPSAGPRVPELHWRSCHQSFVCATARLPLDYRHPRGKLIDVAVIMHRAPKTTRRPETLFFNDGGPGEQILPFPTEFHRIPSELRQHFDIITFDPRGIGFSTPLRCFPSAAAENRLLGPVLQVARFPVGARQ